MSASANSLVAAIVSPQPEVAQAFIERLSGAGAKNGLVDLSHQMHVVVEIPAAEPEETFVAQVKSADFSVMLLRFVDEATLNVARAMLRMLPASVQGRIHFVIAREPGELEFKLSCPQCGQKLMIKDALAFRRTQCPRCKHPFTIPGQTDLVRRELLIPANHNIGRVDLGDQESCLNALRNAYRQAGGARPEEKSTTMRLDDLLPGDVG
ncbi:MAG: hypothetical protein H3C50_03730 [Kiritimatiellae bacterium]|nr:hypothetical protein [Kiritimatiellia bacterium]MCO5068040.1 zinc-ribbon domain-containing protein [Kiritimatiellia bacterium]